MNYYTKLKITIEDSGGESLDATGPIVTTIESEMSDCNVHAWMTVFEKILTHQGFNELNVMKAGAQLAFNEMRSPEDMRKVAKEYDLKLLEDINDNNSDQYGPV